MPVCFLEKLIHRINQKGEENEKETNYPDLGNLCIGRRAAVRLQGQYPSSDDTAVNRADASADDCANSTAYRGTVPVRISFGSGVSCGYRHKEVASFKQERAGGVPALAF